MRDLLQYLILPKPITTFERSYLAKVNRIALAFFALHVPGLMLVAWGNGTNPALALALSLAVFAGPFIAHRYLTDPRSVSVVYGVGAMFFGALLVHFGQGPVQIEMHFYFFALIAMCAVFANPLVIIAAAVTVALHHLALWFVVPRSVFNYDAPVWVVAVHALFVVVESVASCYIARSFFDNVIGLERIVEARTRELNRRNEDMRLVLDNVDQGFATVDRRGRLSPERSRAFVDWFGTGDDLAQAFATRSPEFGIKLAVAWEALFEGMLPKELLVDQLPRSLRGGDGRRFRVAYSPLGDVETAEQWLVVVSDVTAEHERAHAELERREVLQLFERALADRRGVQDYVKESTALVEGILAGGRDLGVLRRRLHTLKGNSAIFGVESIAHLCHELETALVEDGAAPSAAAREQLAARWTSIAASIELMVGAKRNVIELEEAEHAALETEARRHSRQLWARIRSLKLEPTQRRLTHFSDQVRRIAARLEKDVEVVIDDNGLRVDPDLWAPFWSAFVHALRNAVDHGLETAEERAASDKPAKGTVALRTRLSGGRFLVEVLDDGRGIDWEAIRIKAGAAGLPAATGSDLQRALFHDGLTTAASVTELSGRGVGMGALLEATRILRGEIDVDSTPKGGTLVRMSFPESSMVEAPAIASAAKVARSASATAASAAE